MLNYRAEHERDGKIIGKGLISGNLSQSIDWGNKNFTLLFC
jgi:hypothetical protein